MTTLVEARTELMAALVAGGIAVTDAIEGIEPPGGVVYGDGVTVDHIGRGEIEARFRVTLVAGAWDGAAAAGTLVSLISTALGVVKLMDGWAVADVPPDSVVNLAGSRLLGADIVVSRMCTV